MNPNFNSFQQRIAHPFKWRAFMLSKIPAAFIAGVRIEKVSIDAASVSVKKKWLNENPFRSIYFAVLAMAAEMSTGVLCMGALYKRNPAVSMLITNIEGSFIKKAIGTVVFTCTDGIAVNNAVDQAIAIGTSTAVRCTSTGVNEQGEVVAEFYCTWSFKARNLS